MNRHQRPMTVATMVAGLALLGCSNGSDDATEATSPASVSAIEGSDTLQVTLTERAAQRLGIEMGEVTDEAGTSTIPYAAVVYDENGETWAYTSPQPLTFVRTSITVERIDDDMAFLSDGPAVGSEVVTVGTAELFGTEQGLGY